MTARAAPRVSASQRSRADRLAAALAIHYPAAHCALVYSTPHELLVATILSAQTTDVAVNKATPALFKRFPTPAHYASAAPADIEPFIRSLGFFRNKAKAIHSSMADIIARFGGQVPQSMQDLLTLHGVARKTASVVLGNAFDINEGFVVDTHIHRLSIRLGLAPKGSTVAAVEQRLMALFPRPDWCRLSHQFIWHGRAACKARPPGGPCSDHPICKTFGRACELCITARRAPGTRAAAKRRP